MLANISRKALIKSFLKILPQLRTEGSYTELHRVNNQSSVKTPCYSKQFGVAGLHYSVVFSSSFPLSIQVL